MSPDRSAISALALICALGGCSRQDMYDQPRYKPLAASSLFPDGRSARAPVTGTVPRGNGLRTSPAGAGLAPVVTLELLQRGRQRFDIYCSPCHGRTGEGNGMAVRMGFPPPPSYFSARVTGASDTHIYSVISDGYGQMYGYGYRVSPADRWAVVAYIRALQLSREVARADIPESERSRLGAPAGAKPQ